QVVARPVRRGQGGVGLDLELVDDVAEVLAGQGEPTAHRGMSIARPMTAIERLAEWLVALRWEDIPEGGRERARHQGAHVVASMIAGAENDDAASVRRAVSGWGTAGPCTVIPTGERLPLAEALLVGGAHSMALDYDDYVAMGHTGHSAVLVSLALAEMRGGPLRDPLVAQVAANEIGGAPRPARVPRPPPPPPPRPPPP